MQIINGKNFYDYEAIPEWVRLTPPRRRFPIKSNCGNRRDQELLTAHEISLFREAPGIKTAGGLK